MPELAVVVIEVKHEGVGAAFTHGLQQAGEPPLIISLVMPLPDGEPFTFTGDVNRHPGGGSPVDAIDNPDRDAHRRA
jgi:hypothetical protein